MWGRKPTRLEGLSDEAGKQLAHESGESDGVSSTWSDRLVTPSEISAISAALGGVGGRA